jgi:hypothetical protein
MDIIPMRLTSSANILAKEIAAEKAQFIPTGTIAIFIWGLVI